MNHPCIVLEVLAFRRELDRNRNDFEAFSDHLLTFIGREEVWKSLLDFIVVIDLIFSLLFDNLKSLPNRFSAHLFFLLFWTHLPGFWLFFILHYQHCLVTYRVRCLRLIYLEDRYLHSITSDKDLQIQYFDLFQNWLFCLFDLQSVYFFEFIGLPVANRFLNIESLHS